MSRFLLAFAVAAVIQKAVSEQLAQPSELKVVYELKTAEPIQKSVSEVYVSETEAKRQKDAAVKVQMTVDAEEKKKAVDEAVIHAAKVAARKCKCDKEREQCEVDLKKKTDDANVAAKESYEEAVKKFDNDKKEFDVKVAEETAAETLKDASFDAETDELKTCHDNAKKVVDAKVKELNADFKTKTTTMDTCQKDRDKVKKALDSAQTKVDDLTSEIKKIKADIKSADEGGALKFSNSCELEAKSEESKKACTFSKDYNSLKSKLEEKDGKLTTAESDLKEAKQAWKTQEKCEKDEKAVADLKDELDKLNCDISKNVIESRKELKKCNRDSFTSSLTAPVKPEKNIDAEFDSNKCDDPNHDFSYSSDCRPLEKKTDLEVCQNELRQSKKSSVCKSLPTPSLFENLHTIFSVYWLQITGAVIVLFAAFWFIGNGSSDEASIKKSSAPVESDSADVEEEDSAVSDAPSTANKAARKRASTPKKK